jgi:SAM-dependent methyltransferase
MHSATFFYCQRIVRELTARRFAVVELGSRDINGSVRPLFDGQDYTGVDIAPGPGVDVVADGATWGETGAYDLGLCLEVLEHADTAPEIVANLRRLVRPGGLTIITCATDPRAPHSAVDGMTIKPGEYYGNVRPADLIEWLHGCTPIAIEIDRALGDLRATAWLPSG